MQINVQTKKCDKKERNIESKERGKKRDEINRKKTEYR